MKQINVKLLAILFLTSLFTLVGAFFLYRFQKARNAEGLLTRAESKKEEGEYGEAVKYLARYLRLKPDDNPQYANLALTMQDHIKQLRESGELNARAFQQAYAMVEQSVRKNPENRELRETAADFGMQYGRFPDAISHLTYLMKAEANVDPQLQVKLARCYNMSGQDEKAVPELCSLVGFNRIDREFDESAATAPESEEAYELLANIFAVKMRDEDSANAVMNQLVTVNPESFKARLIRARYNMSVNREKEEKTIEADLDRALKLAPDEAEVLLNAADYAMKSRDFDRAKQLYDRCLEKHPDNVSNYRGLASWALSANNDLEAAVDYLNQGLEQDPNNLYLYWMRANIELQSKDFEALDETRKKLVERNASRFFLDFLDARYEMAKENWLQASRKLAEVRPQIAQYQPAWLPGLDGSLTLCYEKTKQHDLRLKACQRLIEANPENVAAREGKIQALLAMGQVEKAAREYGELERLLRPVDDAMPTELVVRRLQMELLQQDQLPETRRDFSEAAALVQAIASRGRIEEAQTARLISAYFQAIGEPEKGEELIDTVKRRSPNDLQFVLNDVRTIAARDGIEAALKRLDAASGPLGDPLSVRLMRCELLARVRPDEAKQKMRIFENDLEAFEPRRRDQGLRALGRIYLLMDEIKEARRLWSRLADDHPSDVNVRLSLFELAMQAGDEEGMQEGLKRIENLVGRNSAEWKWAEAVRLTWRVRNRQDSPDSLEQAKGLVVEAIGQRDGWDALYRLLGQIYVLRSEDAAAIEALEKAMQLGGANPSALRSLASLYNDAGRLESAERILGQLPRGMWTQTEERIKMAILARRNELPQELPYDENSTDPTDHMWVATLLFNAGRLDESEAALRRTLQLTPGYIDGWNLLVQIYLSSGKRDRAEQTIREAELQLPGKDAAYFLGRAYYTMGEWEKSQENLLTALQADPENRMIMRVLAESYIKVNDSDAALNVLDRMLQDAQPNDPGVSPQVRWARRTKATMMASGGAYHEFMEALRLIEANAPEGGVMQPDDMELWAKLSAGRPDGISRQQAIAKLEQTRENRKLTNSELRVLADLYQRQDRWTECKSVMLDLLADRPNEIRLLDPWLTWLLEHDEEQQAAKWIDNCPDGSVAKIRTRAHLDCRRGNSQRAVQQLKTLIPDNLEAKDAIRLQVVAQILEQLGEYDSRMYGLAEKVWRRYVAMRPDQSLGLASFLGRRGNDEQVREALRLCGEALQDGNEATALQLAVAILRTNRAVTFDKQELIGVIRGWFEAAQAAQPDNLVYMIQRAEFEDVVGDFEASEKWMRTYMDRSDVSDRQRAIVANNLAYMLALQGKFEEPAELVEFAMNILGPTADLRDTLGVVYLAKPDVDNAIREFEAAIGDGGATSFKYVHLAMAHLLAGDKEAAATAVKRAHAIGLQLHQLSRLEFENYSKMIEALKKEGLLTDADVTDTLQTLRKAS